MGRNIQASSRKNGQRGEEQVAQLHQIENEQQQVNIRDEEEDEEEEESACVYKNKNNMVGKFFCWERKIKLLKIRELKKNDIYK